MRHDDSREAVDARARREAWEGRDYGPRHALAAVLLFHSAGRWDAQKRQQWWNLTFSEEATTKVLCEFVRWAMERKGEG